MSEELTRREIIRSVNDYLRSSSVRNEQIVVEIDIDSSIRFLYRYFLKRMPKVEEEK